MSVQGAHKIIPIIAIYKIVSPSGSVYIGQTRNFYGRMSQYKGASVKNQVHLYRSLLAHGFERHTFDVVESFEPEIDQSVLNDREWHWWNFYKLLGFRLMNIKEPGNQPKQSEETKLKIGLSNKGKIRTFKRSPDAIEKQRKFMLGNKYKLGFKISPAHKLAISKANKGRRLSDETRRKISISKTGCGNALFGKKYTDDEKATISARNKKRIITPEMRFRMSEPSKRYWEQWRQKQMIKEEKSI